LPFLDNSRNLACIYLFIYFLFISGGSELKQQHRTKYVDMVTAQLAQSNVRFLFSTGQTNTASLMSTLAKKDSKKGYSLPKNLSLPMLLEKYLPFYLGLPGNV
jgi:hypothetical protein